MKTYTDIFTVPAISKTSLVSRQAIQWARHALKSSDLDEAFVWKKAVESIRFTGDVRARSLAIPSKLYGTLMRQKTLATLADLRPVRGHRLGITEESDRLVVSFADVVIGEIQPMHRDWLRPLLKIGATAHLLAVTGTDADWKYLGCNIAIAGLQQALAGPHPSPSASPESKQRQLPSRTSGTSTASAI